MANTQFIQDRTVVEEIQLPPPLIFLLMRFSHFTVCYNHQLQTIPHLSRPAKNAVTNDTWHVCTWWFYFMPLTSDITSSHEGDVTANKKIYNVYKDLNGALFCRLSLETPNRDSTQSTWLRLAQVMTQHHRHDHLIICTHQLYHLPLLITTEVTLLMRDDKQSPRTYLKPCASTFTRHSRCIFWTGARSVSVELL